MNTPRKYKKYDEIGLNDLYYTITKRIRNYVQYSWQWLKNPYNKRTIWVLTEQNEDNEEKIIAHHGLIPTPFIVNNEFVLAGKTENCMSHPIIRGKKIYFPFENKCFEESKSYYGMLFTASGIGVTSKGAPAHLREKLGYKKLNFWSNYFYFVSYKHMFYKIISIEGIYYFLLRLLFMIFKYHSQKSNLDKEFKFSITESNEIIFFEIEQFWLNQKEYYGNTIDRNQKYMNWRITENPYYPHFVAILKEQEEIQAYSIIKVVDKATIQIVDILSNKKEKKLAVEILHQIKIWANKREFSIIHFPFLEGNIWLKEVIEDAGFISSDKLNRKMNVFHPFHLIMFNCEDEENTYNSENWFITALTLEK